MILQKKLDISRQWYIKFENGKAQPSAEIIKKLSELYQVSEDFILQNKIPSLKDFQTQSQPLEKVKYKIRDEFGKLTIADSGAVEVSVAPPIIKTIPKDKGCITIQGYFDGKSIQIDTPEDIQQSFFQGQRFQLIPLYDEEEEKRKQEAWKELQSLVGSIKVSDDFDIKEEIYNAIAEKYLKK